MTFNNNFIVPTAFNRCLSRFVTYMLAPLARYQFLRQYIVRLLATFVERLSQVGLDADIVCSRAKNHYDPQGTVDFSDSATQADTSQAEGALEAFRRGFKPLHQNMASLMYFS